MIVTESPSLRMRAVGFVLGLLPKFFPADTEKLDQTLAKREPVPATMPAALSKACEIDEWEDDGQRAVTLKPRVGGSDWHILYLHGGGYVLPLSPFHWGMIGKLIEATGATVTLPFYALSPEHDHRKGTAFVRRAYDRVRAAHSGPIAIAGDSAGANFALSLVLRLKAAGAHLPDKLVLFSPWLDLMVKDPRAADVEPRDVMLSLNGLRHSAELWAGDSDATDPLMSPLFADLGGLPPLAIFQGDSDLFVVDARTFVAKATEAGVDVGYYEYSGACHDFMLFTFTPESQDCLTRVSFFLRQRRR